ncbi:sulfatase-like hydrolase/transferase [Haloferula sp.]|uniref:sulfatase-like hydrolase/transferase n=1 Tax=Haloferula sp. TaxID=2497595 RepID=UPI00329BBCF6
MRPICIIASALLVALPTQAKQPNILVIMVDDMGFSDLGCYGSTIETPAIDRLASQGTRLANFRVNPMCTVTRTSFLTGHTYSQSDEFKRSLPLPRALADTGYRTSISGKWHQPGHPLDHGFDQFYGFLQGQINCLTGSDAILEQRKKTTPPKGWHATTAFTDHTIKCIDRSVADQKPFFAFLSYNAPHTPLHINRDLVEKYRGKFTKGWQALRRERFERLKKIGLIDDRYTMIPPGPEVREWNKLPADTRTHEDFRMATYAAVIDHIDQNVDRLLKHLDDKGLADDTLVIFLSDNGGDYGNGGIAIDKQQFPWDPKAWPFMSNGWASLKCTPFHYYKTTAFEGGLRVPFIVRWPQGLKHDPDTIVHHQTHITDLYPTFLELAGTAYKPTGKQAPLHGKSLVPLLENPGLPLAATRHPTFWALESTTRGYLDHPWKVVSVNNGPWRLYHLDKDPAEALNLARENPDQLERLANAWQDFATKQTPMPLDWRLPLRKKEHGWGLHRLVRLWGLEDSTPLSSAAEVPLDTTLSFSFAKALDFSKSKDRSLRLYRVQDPDKPVWTADPEPDHVAQGKKTITFDNLPTLESDTTYFLLTDPAWARSGGKPLPPLNDGAYWFRFRTKSR